MNNINLKRVHFEEPRFEPSVELPDEILHLIFTQYLPLQSLVGLSELNRSWHNFFDREITVYKHKLLIPYCIKKAKQTTKDIKQKNKTKYRSAEYYLKVRGKFYNDLQALIEIAKIDPQHDLEAAKLKAESIEDIFEQSKAFVKIVEVEILFNLSQAKVTAQKTIGYERFRIFLEIAKMDPEHDFEEAKNSAYSQFDYLTADWFCEIVETEVLYDLNGAKETAHYMAQSFRDATTSISKAYLAIVKAEVKLDVDQAKVTSQNITDPYYKALADLEIAKMDPQHDLTKAKEAVQEIEDLFQQSNVLMDILEFEVLSGIKPTAPQNLYSPHALFRLVKLQIGYDLAEAKLTVEKIKDSYWKTEALMEIIKVEALLNPLEAKQTVRKISSDYCQASALLEIVKVEALTDIVQAIQTAESITDPYNRAIAFIEIAKIYPQYIVNAKCAALNIKDHPGQQFEVLLEIAEINPLHDLKEAKVAAKEMGVGCQFPPFVRIVKLEAQYNLDQAKLTALESEDLYEQFLAFLKIAKIDPQHNLTEVKLAAERIENPYEQARAFCKLALKDPQYGLTSAKLSSLKIIDIHEKIRILLKIVKTALKI